MTVLSDYVTQVRRLLKDPNGQAFQTSDLVAYINESRGQLALDSESVRFLWAFDTGLKFQLTGAATAGSPILTGFADTSAVQIGTLATGQAFLPQAAVVISSTLTTLTLNVPVLATSSPAPITLVPALQTVTGQEFYNYGTNVDLTNGYLNVIQVKSIAINWGGGYGSYKPVLMQWSFTKFQAYAAVQGPNQLGNPAVWTSYGTYARMRPIPSAPYPMQWDTICSPIPLASDSDPEAIPYPFTDAVKYHATYLALLNAQRKDDAESMFSAYERYTKRGQTFRQRTMVPNVYG